MEDNHNISDKFIIRHNGENLVSTLEPSFLIGSFLFLQVMRTIIKAWTNLNFDSVSITDFGVSCP